MTDIFREVEEDVRREHWKKLWDQYGVYFVGLFVLALAAAGGWQLYQYNEQQAREKAAAAFLAAAELAGQEKTAEAIDAFAAVPRSAEGYAVLAEMHRAALLASKGDTVAAIAAYDAVPGMPEAGEIMGGLARLKAALMLADTAPYDELTARLSPLITETGPWRFAARELQAYAAQRTGQADATAQLEALKDDPAAPAGVRSRAAQLLAAAKSAATPAPAAATPTPAAEPAPPATPAPTQ